MNRLTLTFLIFGLGLAGPSTAEQPSLGEVEFPTSCDPAVQDRFEAGVAQLHHMMYEQARPLFEAVADADPQCAMAHWGIAMTRFQPLWHPTPEENLERGRAAVEAARSIGVATEREAGYVAAVAAFFTDPEPPAATTTADHEARLEAWKTAQQDLHQAFPDDVDAAAFFALSELSHAQAQFAPQEERDFTRQRRVGELLEGYLDDHPEHPGLYHYLIHAYDNAELAHKAREVARGYDDIAPETTHALHMPGHIFVRLGLWEENIEWNERSAEAALRDMEKDAHASAHYVHALDYAMYGYLQLGDHDSARATLTRIQEVDALYPAPFAGYNAAAPQARYYLEQQKWEEAAALEPRRPDALEWDDYPAAEALFHYARGLGAARSGQFDLAEVEVARIKELESRLANEGDDYWAIMTGVLGRAVDGWIVYERGDTARGLSMLSAAADLEDSMEKHPITPGEVLPVRELYGELLLREGRADEARVAFEASLQRTPNRRNALVGLERAEAAGAAG